MNALAKPVIPAVPAAAVFAEIDVADVSASPLNHRKIFNGIDELGEDLKVNGCRVPIKVRPWPGGKTKYQLVYGERRWRGAKAAGVKKLPALIQELNDTQVIEEQLVENVQREDVHPMEEADGYKELNTNHGYSVQQIADKTGKSKAYVHARLKLCEIVGGAAKTAFLENKVNASVALIAARIPVPKLQDAFIKKVLAGESEDQMMNGEWIKVERPLSFREAQVLAQKEFMLRLENAPFPIVDDKLVKGAGSCVGCLFRTGNQRELFDDVKSADVCTNPPCFQKKKDAQTDRELDAWKKEGKKVLSKTEAEKAFEYRQHNDEYSLGWNSTFADATKKPPYDVDRKGRTWEQLFGGKDKVPTVHARDPNGNTWQLVHKASAVKELTKLGVFKEKKASKSSTRSNGPGKSKTPTEHELVEAAVWKKLMVAIADKLEPKLAKSDAGAWRWLVEFLVEFAGLGEGYAPLKAWGGFDIASGPDVEKKLLAGAKTGEDLRRLAVAAVLADRLGMSTATKDVEKLCKPFGVDVKKVALQAADEVKTELAKQKDAKKSPAAKKGK